MHKEEALELCKKHMHKYVLIHTTDGMQYDGIIAHIDDEYVHLAVPVGAGDFAGQGMQGMQTAQPMQSVQGMQGMRAFVGYPGTYGYPGYGYPGYGYGYPAYGYGGRFRRLVLPLAALAAISLLPYF